MDNYTVDVYVFGIKKIMNVRSTGPKDAGEKVMKMPLIDIVKDMTVGDICEGYGSERSSNKKK